jgi:hypothetical protein
MSTAKSITPMFSATNTDRFFDSVAMVKGTASAPLKPMVKATKAHNIAAVRSIRTSF